MKFIPLLLLLICSLFLASCGGGGGDEEECTDSVACIGPDPRYDVDSSKLLGNYNVDYVLDSNTCTGSSPLRNLSENYIVTAGTGYHALPTIEVASSSGVSYLNFSNINNTDGETFFNVFQADSQDLENFISGKVCVEQTSLEFSQIEQGSGIGRARLRRISHIDCDDQGVTIVQGSSPHCEVVYSGEAELDSGSHK